LTSVAEFRQMRQCTMGHCGPSFDSNLRICGIRERIHFHVPWHAWQHRRVSIFRPLKWFAKCVHPTVLIDPQFQHKNHLRPAILRYSSFDKPCQVILFRSFLRWEDPRVLHRDTVRPSISNRRHCVPATTAYATHLDTRATIVRSGVASGWMSGAYGAIIGIGCGGR
jgi:hypothetical protein